MDSREVSLGVLVILSILSTIGQIAMLDVIVSLYSLASQSRHVDLSIVIVLSS